MLKLHHITRYVQVDVHDRVFYRLYEATGHRMPFEVCIAVRQRIAASSKSWSTYQTDASFHPFPPIPSPSIHPIVINTVYNFVSAFFFPKVLRRHLNSILKI